MQPDPEHQQDDPDLGQFGGEVLIGNESWGEGPDGDPGQQVSRDRRQPQPLRQEAEDEGEAEGGDDRGDQGGIVGQGRELSGWRA